MSEYINKGIELLTHPYAVVGYLIIGWALWEFLFALAASDEEEG